MPVRRRHVELSVERPAEARGPAGSTARLSASFEVGPDGEGPSAAELSRAFDDLLRDLEGLLGPAAPGSAAARPTRGVDELVETYRPRQRELVDLLLADGEITAAEHALLIANFGRAPVRAPERPAAAALSSVGETPIAAVPLAAEPKLPPARPVPELLRTFGITSLRQAGAVRARRQISFAEYMALKRHFESSGAPSEGKNPPATGA